MDYAMRSPISQLGATLLEILLTLAIAASLLIGISSYLWDQSRSQQDIVAAQFQNLIATAAQNYVQDNYQTLLSGSLPATITVSQLITGGYLSSSMASTNVLGQTVCVKVVSPVSNSLAALVMATGTATTYARAAHIAALIGALGGAVNSSGDLKGTGGSWSISSSTLSGYGSCASGSMVEGQFAAFLYFSNGSLVSDFLHRSYVGALSANTMNVPLGLAVETLGGGCSSTYVGFVGRDSTGQILACTYNGSSYIWTATGGTWKTPVTDFSSLPTLGNSNGDVRMELTNYRAYVWQATPKTWKALAVDDSGNMSIPGTLTTANISASGTIAATGTVTSSSTTSGNTLVSNLLATSGASCTGYTSGAIARNSDGTGKLLSCQSGVWANLGGLSESNCAWYGTSSGGDNTWHTDMCPTGYYMKGWHAFASTYLDDNDAAYCCQP